VRKAINKTYSYNNIMFRIASADAFSKFKAAQAHSLIQVSRKEFKFKDDVREVLLLSYDVFSSWLLHIERTFLVNSLHTLPADFAATIQLDFNEVFKAIEEVIAENADIFSSKLAKFINNVHTYSRSLLAFHLHHGFTKDATRAYGALAGICTLYLQHLLLALHEFNNNSYLKQAPFICVCGFDTAPHTAEVYLNATITRARYFNEQYGLNNFTVKSYTDDHDAVDELLLRLQTYNIKAAKEEKQ
jgi:hypothetical protein